MSMLQIILAESSWNFLSRSNLSFLYSLLRLRLTTLCKLGTSSNAILMVQITPKYITHNKASIG